MNRREILQVGASLLVTSAGWARRPGAQRWEQELATFVQQGLAQTHTPGLSVAMVRAGRTVFTAGYGLADVAAARPVAPRGRRDEQGRP